MFEGFEQRLRYSPVQVEYFCLNIKFVLVIYIQCMMIAITLLKQESGNILCHEQECVIIPLPHPYRTRKIRKGNKCTHHPLLTVGLGRGGMWEE